MERLGSFASALSEIKGVMMSLDRRLQQAELDRVGASAVLEAKITAAHTRLDAQQDKLNEHRADIDAHKIAQKEVDRQLGQFATAYRIMAFVGSALGLSIIALIWGLLTGQVHLTFGP